MKIFGSITELVSAVFRKDSQQITVQPNSGTTYTASRVVNLPPGDAAHTLVSADSIQTLTNKSVDGDTNTLSNVAASSIKTVLGDANKVILRDGSGAVVSAQIVNANIDAAAAIALTKLATVTASRALQSDGTGIVSASSVTTTELGHVSGVTSSIQTQLNAKEPTITVLPVSKGGTNSSTSLNNSRVMISSGSAIVEGSAITASRALASDAGGLPVASTTTSTELGYVSGVTSAVQTQINAKADTSALTAHTGASTGVHGVAGSVVGTTDAQVLTNKDIDGGTASNTSRTTLPKASKSTLDALTRKQATLVYGSDTNKVYADDGSTLKEIGSGSSGINYLNSQFNADALGTVELSVGDTLASTTRANPTQWGNSAASALITQSTNSTLRGTTNYLVAFSANAQFVESPLFSIDGQDLSKPLLVQFDVSGVATADDVQVYIARYNSSNVLQERILVAGTASATSPNSAQVPTAVTTFRGFFIPSSTATDKYSIRWRRNANNTSMRLDTFIVGPQSLAQAAVVTAWQSYTPTYTGFGTVTSSEMFWRRNGDQLEVRGNFTTGTTTAVEARLSFPDVTTTASAFPSIRIAGSAIRAGSSATFFSDNVLSEPSVSYFTFGVQASTTNGLTKALGSGFAATTKETISASTSISQWSSGTTTLADRAVEEFAWNSDPGVAATTNYSNSVYFGNGPQGTPTLSYASTTNSGFSRTTYYCRFQTPILSTDKISLELSGDGGLTWTDASQNESSCFLLANSAYYGAQYLEKIDSTTVRIGFGNAGRRPDTTFGGVGAAWSTLSNFRWRVRKVSGGAAVGFPVSARNVVGDTSGTAVPTGMIGQYAQLFPASPVTPGASTAYTVVTSTTLQPGIYAVTGHIYMNNGGLTGFTVFVAGISTSASTIDSAPSWIGAVSTVGAAATSVATPTRFFNVSTSQTVYLLARLDYSSLGSTSYSTASTLSWIRIA